jgi:putative ABC transport system permease protein
LLHRETERRFVDEGQQFDIAVGASGSTQQLVLSTIYYIGQPSGNIKFTDYLKLKEEPDVVAAFPISMGDSYRGFRIIGTTPDLFAFEWKDRVTGEPKDTFRIAQGRVFEKPREAVIGAAVAADTGLAIGSEFASQHGLMDMQGVESHEEHPYTVVGIAKASGSPADRAIYCSYDSIWEVHEHEYGTASLTGADSGIAAMAREAIAEKAAAERRANSPAQTDEEADHAHDEEHHHGDDTEAHDDDLEKKEVTAVLIVLESPGLRYEFLGRLKEKFPHVAGTIPVREIQTLYNQLLGTARQVMLAIGFLVMIISSLSILIGLYLSILQRKRDLAVMRALGAAAGEVFGAVLIEAFWVTLLGIGFGYVGGIAVTSAIGAYLAQTIGFTVSVLRPTPDMISAYSIIVLMGMAAGLLPAWQAYRTDIAHDLAEL